MKLAALLVVAAVLSTLLTPHPTTAWTLRDCRPRDGFSQARCEQLARFCALAGAPMDWMSQGCTDVSGRSVGDGGCQCGSAATYCGFTCASECRKRAQCVWRGFRCENKRDASVGRGGFSTCPRVATSSPTPATTAAPTICTDECVRGSLNACNGVPKACIQGRLGCLVCVLPGRL